MATTNESKSLYARDILRWSGVAAIAVAVGYLVISICIAIAGFPLPSDGSAWITYLDGKLGLWNLIIWLSIITDILYIVVALGFIQAFRNFKKILAVLAGVLFALFVVIELSTTWSLYPTILDFYQKYVNTDSVVQQTMYLTAIEHSSAFLHTAVGPFFTIVLPSIAVILYSWVMYKSGEYHKLISFIGVVSGVCNIVSVFGKYLYAPLEKLVMPGSFLALFWFLGVGISFLKKSRNINLNLDNAQT